jgi:hypothetical protein
VRHIALFGDLSAAEAPLERNERFLPSLADAVESWRAMLLPIAHRGECNHIERSNPGVIFDIDFRDPGGPLFVMTTAGFNIGPELDTARVIYFRVYVDQIHDWHPKGRQSTCKLSGTTIDVCVSAAMRQCARNRGNNWNVRMCARGMK